MKNILFNYYEADIKRSIPLGTVDLHYVLNAIKKPKKDIKYIFRGFKNEYTFEVGDRNFIHELNKISESDIISELESIPTTRMACSLIA